MVRLKKLTPSSWLVITDTNEKVGLLSEQRDKLKFIAKAANAEFRDKEDVSEFFEQPDLFQTVIEVKSNSEEKEYFVNGFPVKTGEAHEVKDKSIETQLPIYSKSENSDSYYVAGYFCLNFNEAGWTHAFCPRYKTLDKYEWKGPFKTEDEMKAELRLLKSK
tara:strand:- start:726 stop:1211 length:486 start_codon:yes stop_codon:yes gene_type:complete